MKVSFVFGSQKCRLMMIEPPSEFLRRGVFEIDDGILIAVKHRHVEEIPGPMKQTFVLDFRVGMNSFFVESRKGCGRRDPVKTMTVIKQTKFHLVGQKSGGL